MIYRNKKLVLILCMMACSLVGCTDQSENKVAQEETYSDHQLKETETGDVKGATYKDEETHENEEAHDTHEIHSHDEGYTELIHNGFSLNFQTLMEEMYSRINYSMMGMGVESITPIDKDVMTQVEELTTSLNPIQDNEILEIVQEAHGLFDKINDLIDMKAYEKLEVLNDIGQELYNRYYEWLINVASHHTHD